MIYLTSYSTDTLQCTSASTDSGFTTLEEVHAMMGEPVSPARHMLCYDGICFTDFVLSLEPELTLLSP